MSTVLTRHAEGKHNLRARIVHVKLWIVTVAFQFNDSVCESTTAVNGYIDLMVSKLIHVCSDNFRL